MNTFWDGAELRLYTDGSSCSRRARQGYGWVLANPFGTLRQARAISMAHDATRSSATRMESAAIIDGLAEIAHRGVPVVVVSDTQSLPSYIEKYRTGECDSSIFFNQAVVASEDRARLFDLLNHLDLVRFEWVKGHGQDFHNLVTDQMLRHTVLDGHSEAEAVQYAETALARGMAVVRRPVRVWDEDQNKYQFRNMMVEVAA